MASKGRIDSIADIPKIQDEIKFLTGSLERILDQIETIAEAGAKIKFEGFGQAKSIKDTAAASAEMEKALKDVEGLTAELNKVTSERMELEKRLISIEKERISTSQASGKATQDEATWSLKKVSAIFEEVKLTKELKDAINSVLGTKQENIKRLAEEQARLKEVNASIRDNEKAYKSGAKTSQEFMSAQQRLLNEQNTLKVAVSELTSRIKMEEKIEQAASGTASEKSLILNKLKEAYRSLSEEQKNNSAIGGQLLNEINKLDEGLKEYDATIGNHQRNVGDYAIAGRSMRTELMLMTEQLATMKMEGLEDSEAFKELSLRAGEMKDAFDDARSEVKKLASDTKALDQLISVAEGLAGAYTAIEGASALMGVENEELQQTFVKLQAAMAVLNGLRAVQTTLQKESAAASLAEIVQKKIKVALTYAETKAETGGIVTRKLATAAQWALNKAMLANPVGLLLAAVGGLIAGGIALYRVLTKVSDSQQLVNDIQEKTIENSSQEIAQFSLLKTRIDEARKGRGDLTKAVAEYNDKFGQYGKLTKEVLESEELLADAYRNTAEGIMVKAKAAAIEQLMTEAMKEQNKTLLDGLGFWDKTWNLMKSGGNVFIASAMNAKTLSDRLGDQKDRVDGLITSYSELLPELEKFNDKAREEQQQKDISKLRVENMKTGLAKELAAIKVNMDEKIEAAKGNEELIALIRENGAKAEKDIRKKYANDFLKNEQDTIAKLNESRIALMDEGFAKELASLREQNRQKISDLENQLRTEENLTKVQWDRISQMILNSRKQLAIDEEKLITEAEIKANQNQLETINNKLDAVKAGTEEELKLKLDSLELQRKIEVAEAEKLGKETDSINKKYDKLAADESYNFLLAQLDVESRTRVLSLDRSRQIELRSLRDQLENKLLTSEEYAKKVEEVESKYGIKKAENAVENAEKELAKLKAMGADTLAAEEKLVAAQMALDDAKTANFVQNREKEEAAQQKLNEKLSELGQELFNTSQALANASFATRIQNIDATAKKDEQEKENELARAGNNQALIDQINAKYDAKEKHRDAQRRKIEIEQAKFAKTAALFQIAINTAQAISKIWAEVPKADFGISTIALTAVAAGVGLAQAAAIAAQPLPKYWRGRETGPAEWAIVGDQGMEAIQYPSGETFLTPDKPTITFLPARARVIPNKDLVGLAEMTAQHPISPSPAPLSSYDFRRLEKEVAGLYSGFSMLADTVRNKKEFHLNITERGMWKVIQNENSFQEYLNRSVRI